MQDISVLETLSEEIGQIKDAAVFIKGGVIEWVGTTKDVPKELSKPDKNHQPGRPCGHSRTCQHTPPYVSVPHTLHSSGKGLHGAPFITERVFDACVVLLPTVSRPAACRYV